jgi:outer membrane receptor for ferrienterochelin and colicins
LPFATISLNGGQYGSSSDEEGFFKIENLPAGSYTVSATFLGYDAQTQQISLKNNESASLNFSLLESASMLNQVVVTGTMKPTYVTDSPVKVDVLTAKYLDTYLPAAASSIMDGVKMVNGVQEVVACGVCFTNSISINGLPGPYTAVLLDGMPMYGNLASVYGLNGIPNTIIDRFEVIKGPNSTLYGSEAVAGVINIITKDPAKQPFFAADIMGTTHLESFGNVAFAPKLGKTAGFVGLNYALIDGFDDRNQDFLNDRINLDRYALFTKWDLHRKSGKKFNLAGKYYYEDRRNGVEAFLNNRNYRHLRGSSEVYGESIYTQRGELFGTYELPTAENLRLDFSLSQHRQDSYYGDAFYQAEQGIAFANLIWDKQIKRHSLVAGLTSRLQRYDDNTVATQAGADRQFTPGIFVQDEWEMSKRLTLLTGARLDHYDQHGLIFSPRLSTKYKMGDWTALRANFGTGFRIVNLFTEDHAFVTGQRRVEIAEELRPEKSYNGTFNFNHIYTLGNSQGSLDVDAFFTYFTNKITPDYDQPGKIVYANTDGHAMTKGIGLNINQEFAFPLSLTFGFTVQKATQTQRNEAGDLATRPIEFSPDWSGIFNINYQWKKAGLSLAYSIRATGPMELPLVFDLDENGQPLSRPRPERSKPFSFHNLQISKRFSKNWTAYIGGQNLLDFVQPYSPLTGYNDPNAQVGFSQHFDTAYAYAPIHGREFYAGLKLEW